MQVIEPSLQRSWKPNLLITEPVNGWLAHLLVSLIGATDTLKFTNEVITEESVSIEPITFAARGSKGKLIPALKVKTGRKEFVLTTGTIADLANLFIENSDKIQQMMDETEDAAENGVLFQDGKVVGDEPKVETKKRAKIVSVKSKKESKPAVSKKADKKPAKKDTTEVKAANAEVSKALLSMFS